MVQHIRRTMSRGTGVSRGRGVNRGGGGRGGEEDQWRVWRRRGDEQTFTTRPSVGRGRGRGILQHPANHVMGFRQERGTLYQPLMTAPPPPSYPLLQHPQFHQPNLPQHVRYTTPPLQPRLSLPPPHPPPHPHRPPHRSAHHHRYRRRGRDLLHRPWEIELDRQTGTSSSTTISVMTYNTLAQSLIAKNMHLYHESEALQWDKRKDLLMRELRENRTDLMCLQEVDEEHYHDWFLPELTKLGYSGLYKKRTGDHSDGCAVFYNQSRLKLQKWSAVEFQKRVRVLDRDNVAVVATFQVAISRRKTASFCIANTHLLFNPKAGDVKLAQLVYLLAELNQLATPPAGKPHPPYILCGDLNSLPGSPLLEFIKSGSLDYKEMTRGEIGGFFKRGTTAGGGTGIPSPLFPPEVPVTHTCHFLSSCDSQNQTIPESLISSDINFYSAYPPTVSSPRGPTHSSHGSNPGDSGSHGNSITTYHRHAFEMVDYIHYTAPQSPPPPPLTKTAIMKDGKKMVTPGFRLLKRKSLITPDRLREMGPQPHHLLPSDHHWLLAVFQLTI